MYAVTHEKTCARLHSLLGFDSVARLLVRLVALQSMGADLVMATSILVGLEHWQGQSGSARSLNQTNNRAGHLRNASSSRERPEVSGHRNQIKMASTKIQQQ